MLDWVYERFRSPETIFVTGVSAGAYGSIGWAPHIIDHYPDSKVVQLGDCGAGVITDTFFMDSFPSWKAESLIPDWIDVRSTSSCSRISISGSQSTIPSTSSVSSTP